MCKCQLCKTKIYKNLESYIKVVIYSEEYATVIYYHYVCYAKSLNQETEMKRYKTGCYVCGGELKWNEMIILFRPKNALPHVRVPVHAGKCYRKISKEIKNR